MNGTLKTVLQVALLLFVIWALAQFTGSSASVSVPGGYARIGKGKGRCGGRKPRRYWQVATGMGGEFVSQSAPQSGPAGVPYSTF